MRVIKFRAKVKTINIDCDKNVGDWVCGDLHLLSTIPHIHTNSQKYIIDTETIGQYTGMQDKNDVEIYEGDILAKENERDKYVIVWNEYYSQFQGMWRKNPLTAVNIYSMISLSYKVIGNIHDNPELL